MRSITYWASLAIAWLSCNPSVNWSAEHSGAPNSKSSPNVVLIFIDDLGYADIGPFGAINYKTPNLDRLAVEGRKFTDFIVPSAVCSASRSALLTGCLPERIGFRGALGPAANVGIHADEVTLAEVCKSQGYNTACFGKWHLGSRLEFLPLQHGFDQFYGIPYSNDMWPWHPAAIEDREKNPNAPPRYPPLPMFEGNQIVDEEVTPDEQKEMTRQFTHRAVEFIRESRKEPFFLYLPHAMVHVPLYSSEPFENRSEAGPFGDAMQEIDWSVGEIVRVLQELSLDENTLLIFTSDNGPWLSYGSHAGSAAPLREGKGTSWEGGIRVPTIMKWPGRIPSDSQTDCLASTIDLLPTIATLIGATPPSHKIDGIDVSSILTEESPAGFPDRIIPIYYAAGELQAIRNDRWKILFPHVYRTIGTQAGRDDGKPIPYQNVALQEPELYDLDHDVGERSNLYGKLQDSSGSDAASHQQAFKVLFEAAEVWRDELGDGLHKRTGHAARPIGRIEK